MADPEMNPAFDEPDWSLLPRHAVRFFGLQKGFDRKDLKRSYNRLLRRFKPEKFPEEFQRIRAAYEELERQIRYGQDTSHTVAADVWELAGNISQQSTDELSSFDSPTGRDVESLISRLESGGESVAELYAEYKQLPQKTPPDFYALALMADLVETGDKLWFLRWILQGLAAFPDDPGLQQLAHGFLTHQTPLQSLPKVLLACSKAVGNDSFYALTEGAWDRILRTQPFPKFVKALEQCEAQLEASGKTNSEIVGRVTFYIHAIRFAQWKDRTGWKERALSFIEENFDQVPPHLENDFDMLGVVQEYHKFRERFVSTHPICQQLDQVLEALFIGDPVAADRAVVDSQLALLESPEAIADAFPIDEPEMQLAFYQLWGWVVGEAAARLAPEEETQVNYQLWRERVKTLLVQLNDHSSTTSTFWSFAAYAKFWANCGGIGLILFSLFFSFFFSWCYFFDKAEGENIVLWGATLAFVSTVIGGYYAGRWWNEFLLDRWYPYCQKMGTRCYRKMWRPAAFAFLQRSVLDYFAFRELVSEQAPYVSDESSWVDHFVQSDVGLAVYSLALRFQA